MLVVEEVDCGACARERSLLVKVKVILWQPKGLKIGADKRSSSRPWNERQKKRWPKVNSWSNQNCIPLNSHLWFTQVNPQRGDWSSSQLPADFFLAPTKVACHLFSHLSLSQWMILLCHIIYHWNIIEANVHLHGAGRIHDSWNLVVTVPFMRLIFVHVFKVEHWPFP